MIWCKKYVRLLTVVKMKLRQSRMDETPPLSSADGSDLPLFNHPYEFDTTLGNVTTVLLLYCCCFIVDKLAFCLDFYYNNVNRTIIQPQLTRSELNRYDSYRERHKLLCQQLKVRLTSSFNNSNYQSNLLNRSSISQKRCLLNVQMMKFKKFLIHYRRNNNNDTSRLKMRTCFGVQHNNRLHKVLVMAFIVWSLPFVSPSSSSSSSYEPQLTHSPNVIKTKYGLLRGVILKNEPLVEGYLGIPYATPPIGSLRYMPPITPSAWKNIRLVDNYPPVCPQSLPHLDAGMDALFKMPRYRFSQLRNVKAFLGNYSEDCLYLNMFIPKTEIIEKTSNPLATLVYIHGESFEWNSGNFYDGTILAAHSKVIVVTLNFRIGILGFLKTGTKDSSQGNFGLMDLVAALHWLRENLPAFNGNPNMITLMGHGQGAALANILAISPVSNDLIKRVILISGSALSPWAIQQDPLALKKKVATDTGCHGDVQEEDLAPCLRQKSLSDLLAIKLDPPRFLQGFAPFTDGSVIPSEIDRNSMAKFSELSIPSGGIINELSGIEMANFAEKEFLFGVTSIESYLDFSAQDLEFGFNETKKDRILRTFVRNVFSFHLNEIFSALKNEYTDWERTSRNQIGSRDAALDLVSDGHTVAPLVKIGYLHSLLGGKSYFMHFKHKTEERDYPQRYGSVRGEDVPFFFGLPASPLFSNKITDGDIQSSEILMFYLGNFIRTGSPNGNELSENHPTLNIATIDKLKELKKRVLRRPQSSSFQHFQMENYYTINNISLGTSTRSDFSEKFYNSSKFYNNRPSSLASSSSSSSSTYTLRKRRSSKGSRRAYSSHRISRKSLQNSLTGTSIEENFSSSEEDVPATVVRHQTDSRPMNSSHEILVPYWKEYESVNQMYLEFSLLPKIKHHYRGHKLSMWLSLIPQIQNPEYNSEVSMRHHIFEKDDSIYYDGKIRQQSMSKPPKNRVYVKTTTSVPIKSADKSKKHHTASPISTECPINTTKSPLIVAAVNHVNTTTMKTNPFRELISSQYQNYSMAFLLTIFIGCCLLLLNIIIFCAIYYQRVKRKKYVNCKKIITGDMDEFQQQACSPERDKRIHLVNSVRDEPSTHCPAHEKQFFCSNEVIRHSNTSLHFSRQHTPVPKRSANNHHRCNESTTSIDKQTSTDAWSSPGLRNNGDNGRMKNSDEVEIPEPPPPPKRTPAKKRVHIQEINV